MLLLVSGATKTIKKYADHPNLGCLLTPRSGNSFESMCGLPFACDNSAFSDFDEDAFLKMLKRCQGKNPIFVTAPDVVGDAPATMELFGKWQAIIKSYKLPVALVVQDGQERENMPWRDVSAIFIGGSTDYKLSPTVRQLVKEAKFRGKWVHMGRVNSLLRIDYARDIGCDSVDGSGYSMFPDTHIPKALKHLETEQLTLFDL